MKFYDSIGPNPRMVRMFMAEKGIEIPKVTVDLRGGENRRPEHLARNPAGQMPSLELDDGSHLSEVTAICEYLEEKQPDPAVVGKTPEQRAETRMWTRRIDLNVCEPMGNGFRYGEGLKLFEARIHCVPEASAGLKAVAQHNLGKLDGWIEGREWICGDRFTMADLLLFAWLDFFPKVGQPLDPAHENVAAWYERVAARPSAAASQQ